MSNKKNKNTKQFGTWLEDELLKKVKISMSEAICSGAEKMNCTIDTAKKYLGTLLISKTSRFKLNLDEIRGIKFLEYRKDFNYTGDREEYEDFSGTENVQHSSNNMKKIEL